MRCYQVKRLIDQRIDNEVPEPLRTRLDAHLKQCPQCQALYHQASELNRMLQVSTEVELPSWIHHRILDSCYKPSKQRETIRRRQRLQAIPVSLAVAASLYIGILLGVQTFTPQETQSIVSSEYVDFGENTLFAYENGGGY